MIFDTIARKLRFSRWKWEQRLREAVEWLHQSIPSWATLRTLGQSRIVGTTMLVPFLGTILLFNQAVIDAIRVPEELLTAWGLNLAYSTQEVSMMRLKLTYFGLCLVGIASFMFTLLCPEVVKRYASAAEYVRGDEPLFTEPQVEAAAGVIIDNFQARTNARDYGREPSFSCPRPLLLRTYVVLEALGTAMLLKNEEGDQASAAGDGTEPKSQEESAQEETEDEREERWAREERYNLWNRHEPGADVNKIMDLIFKGSRADQGYFYLMTQIGRSHPIDVMSLSYMWESSSRPLIRLMTSLVFLFGFALLSIPTIFTFVTVLRRTIF